MSHTAFGTVVDPEDDPFRGTNDAPDTWVSYDDLSEEIVIGLESSNTRVVITTFNLPDTIPLNRDVRLVLLNASGSLGKLVLRFNTGTTPGLVTTPGQTTTITPSADGGVFDAPKWTLNVADVEFFSVANSAIGGQTLTDLPASSKITQSEGITILENTIADNGDGTYTQELDVFPHQIKTLPRVFEGTSGNYEISSSDTSVYVTDSVASDGHHILNLTRGMSAGRIYQFTDTNDNEYRSAFGIPFANIGLFYSNVTDRWTFQNNDGVKLGANPISIGTNPLFHDVFTFAINGVVYPFIASDRTPTDGTALSNEGNVILTPLGLAPPLSLAMSAASSSAAAVFAVDGSHLEFVTQAGPLFAITLLTGGFLMKELTGSAKTSGVPATVSEYQDAATNPLFGIKSAKYYFNSADDSWYGGFYTPANSSLAPSLQDKIVSF